MKSKMSYQVISGYSVSALDSGAFACEYVVRVFKNRVFTGFLARISSPHAIRYFTSRASARKAITREKRGEYHK